MCSPFFQSHPVEVFHGPCIAFFATDFLIIQWQCNIFHCIFKRDEVEGLKNKPDKFVPVKSGLFFA